MKSKYFSIAEVQEMARRRIEHERGIERGAKLATAADLGISPQQLWNELNCRPSKRLLDWLGLEKVTHYRVRGDQE